MFGSGVLRGMLVTLRHFIETYTENPRRVAERAKTPDAVRQTPESAKGLFTVQYPEEKLAIPERFRFFPMLIVEAETGQDWCTSCGICAKVCPPQCIWIVRGTKPDGKPKPEPEEFYIDTTICMQCGYCAEFCPFDAIKMNHDYELSTFERHESAIYNKDMLSVTTTYYARTHPRAWAEESAARAAKEKKEKPVAAPAPAPKPAPAPTPVPTPVAAAPAPAAPAPAATTPTEPGAKPKPMSAKAAKAARLAAEGGAPEGQSAATEVQPPAVPAAAPTEPGAKPKPMSARAAKEARLAAQAVGEGQPATTEAPQASAAPAAPAAAPGQETLPSGKPKPISARAAKEARLAAQAAGGEAPSVAAAPAPAPVETPLVPAVTPAPAAAPGQETLPSGKPKPISARAAKEARLAAQAAGGEVPPVVASPAPAPVETPVVPATPEVVAPAAPMAAEGQELLPSGRPKPISARLAKQMREQAQQAGGAGEGHPPTDDGQKPPAQ